MRTEDKEHVQALNGESSLPGMGKGYSEPEGSPGVISQVLAREAASCVPGHVKAEVFSCSGCICMPHWRDLTVDRDTCATG